MTGVLESIQELNLNWCKLLPYSDESFGGWVAENFLGFSRIVVWYYSILLVIPDPPPYCDPTSDFGTWNMKQNKNWLLARDLDSSGNAGDLKARVAEFMNMHPIPDPKIITICNTKDVIQMIKALHTMLSICMSLESSNNTPEILGCSVRYFLSKYKIFDETLNTKADPAYIRHYNFMSLLNLPNTIDYYGSLRHLWEGSLQGEGYLRTVKSEIKIGLVRNWQKWVLNTILVDKAYDCLLSKIPDAVSAIKEDLYEFKLYNSSVIAEMQIYNGKPFSAFCMDNDNDVTLYFMAFRKQNLLRCIQLYISDPETGIGDILYFTVNHEKTKYNDNEYIELSEDMMKHNLTGLLFLPKITEEGIIPIINNNTDVKYCCVKSNWK